MKVRKTYTIFINRTTKMIFYGGSKFRRRISNATSGEFYDVSFNQLVCFLRFNEGNYTIIKRTF